MSLRDELLAIDGVLDAHVDDADRPGGVKVRLDTGADADTVGTRVQEVLASHGLRSRVGPRHVEPGAPPPPPGAPAPVVSLPSRNTAGGSGPISLESVADAALEAISIAEHSSGRLVTATAVDGRTASRPAGEGDEGLAAAVVAAVSDLVAAGAAPPRLVGVEDIEVDGTPVVVVVLATSSGVEAGAAVVAGARSRALGMAAWKALG